MDTNRIWELAIAELERQRAGIDHKIATIRAELNGTGSAALQKELAPSSGTRRRRTPAERRAQAKRMKEYWAAKKAQDEKPAATVKKPPARVTKVRAWTTAEKKALSLKMKEAWKRRAAAARKGKAKSQVLGRLPQYLV